ALTEEMCQTLTEALLAWRADPAIDLIILDHAPDTRGFCAGGDVVKLAEGAAAGDDSGASFFRTEYRLNDLIFHYPKPYVAFIDGIVMGGGVGISVHGSHRVATERTVFAMPEVGIGLLPDVGGGWFLPRLAGRLGYWLGLTGARLKGEDVTAAGVATHFAASDACEALKADLAKAGEGALDAFTSASEGSFAAHRAAIEACFAHESVEAIREALVADGGDWASKQAAAIDAASPLTLKVALRQLREGERLSDFKDNMRMEYRLVTRMIKTRNFQEGIRAALIDKTKDPKWEPGSLAEVDDAHLDSLFASLGDRELDFLQAD
ncbi:MAG: enoyl-CoA hydratase/isomerase family protein, partial [Pseudomonadota bacterium]